VTTSQIPEKCESNVEKISTNQNHSHKRNHYILVRNISKRFSSQISTSHHKIFHRFDWRFQEIEQTPCTFTM